MQEAIVDIETSDLDGTKLWLVGVWLLEEDEFYFFEFHEFTKKTVKTATYFDELQRILNEYVCVFHGGSFDIKILEEWGWMVGEYEDTMLMSYADYPGRPLHKGAIAHNNQRGTKKIRSGHALANWGFILDLNKMEQPDFSEYSSALEPYCKRDLEVTGKLYKHLYSVLTEEGNGAYWLYKEVDLPFVSIIISIERNGLFIDSKSLKSFSEEMEQAVQEVDLEILDVCSRVIAKKPKKYKKPLPKADGEFRGQQLFTASNGELYVYLETQSIAPDEHWYQKVVPFNPNSGDHIAWALQELYEWHPEPHQLTEKGKPRTGAEILEELEYDLARLLVKRSKPQKMATTYGASLWEMADENGFIHGSINPAVTLTGRLSSSAPNLQNFPKHGEMGATVRKIFIAPDGYKAFAIDCSGFQMRICAWYLDHLFGGKLPDASLMKDDFNHGFGDPHKVAASKIFGKPIEEINDDERFIAKKGNFGDIFGIGVAKLATEANVSKAAARDFLAQKRERFPSVGASKEAIIADAVNNGGVFHSLYGRRFVYPDLLSDDKGKRARAERQLFNAVIQGTEADIMKMLCLDLSSVCVDNGAVIAAVVHDEVFGYVRTETAEKFLEEAIRVFSGDYLPGLKMKGDGAIGDNWYECH